MSTNVGSANFILTANTTNAKREITSFAGAAKTALGRIEAVKLSVKGTDALNTIRSLTRASQTILGTLEIKPKTGPLKQTLAGLSGLTVRVDVKPNTGGLKTALAAVPGLSVGVTAKLSTAGLRQAVRAVTGLSVTVSVKPDLTESRRQIAGLSGAKVSAAVQFNRAGIVAALAQITGLRVTVGVKPITAAQINAALSGIAAPKTVTLNLKGDAEAKIAQLRAKINDLKTAAAASVTVNLSAVTAVSTALNKQIADLRALETTLRTLLSASGGAGRGGTGGGSPGGAGLGRNTTELLSQLERLNNAYKRGDVSAEFYGRRLGQLDSQLKIAARAAGLSAAEMRALDRARTTVSGGLARIQSDKIVELRTALSGARAQFDAAAAAATNLAGRRAAIGAYKAELAAVEARLRALAASGNLTAKQLGSVETALARIAREKNTISGGINIAGLSGNVLNSLRGLPGILGSIGGPLAGAANGASALGGSLGEIGKAAGPLGLAIGGVVLALAALTAGIAASVKTAAEYEQKLADIRALTQPTAIELEKLKDATINVGKPLGVGMREAAGAVLELNRAGLTASETVGGGLAGALNLARASGISAAEGAVIATAAMTAFGLSAKDLPGVADVFANFANKTFLGAEDLSKAIAAVGPVAKSSGIGLTQFSGIMATLAQGGFRRMDDAGTSLKVMLLSLQAPSSTGQRYLSALGVSAFDASGKLKPFEKTVGDLRGQLIKLNPEAQKKALREIFGQDAIRAAEILLVAGPKAINANSKAMEKQGEAARVAKERLDSLRGSQDKLRGVLEEVRVKVGTPFLGFLTGIVKGATAVVQAGLNMANGVGRAGLAFQQFRQNSEQQLGGLFNIVKSVFGGIAGSYETILKPILNILGTAWGIISTAAGAALTILYNIVAGIFSGISGLITGLVGAFGGGSSGIKINLAGIAAALSRWAETARAYIIAVGRIAGTLPKAFADAGQGIGRILGGLGKIFGGVAILTYDSLVRPLIPVLDFVKTIFKNTTEYVGGVLTSLTDYVSKKFAPFVEFLDSLGAGIGAGFARIVDSVGERIRGSADTAADTAAARLQRKAYEAAIAGQERSSRGFALVGEGIQDITDGYDGLKTSVSGFKAEAAATFADVPAQIQKARVEAERLRVEFANSQKDAAPTGITTKAKPLESGTQTLADLGLEDGGKKKKISPAEQVALTNALSDYKKKLDGLNVSQLLNEKLTQTRLKDNARLKLVLSEIAQRTTEQAAATRRGIAATERDLGARAKLVTNVRSTIEAYKRLSDQGKVTADVQQRFADRLNGYAVSIGKLPAELRKGFPALYEQALALSKASAGQVEASKAVKLHGISLQDFKATLKNVTGERLKSLADEARAVNDSGKLAAVSAEIKRREVETEKKRAAALKLTGAALAEFKTALRSAGSERLKALETETRAAGQESANAAVRAEITRRKKAADKEEKDAAAARKRDAEQAARLDESRAKSAATLATQIIQLTDKFRLQVAEGRTSAASLQAYEQALDNLGTRLGELPESYRAAAAAALETGRGMVSSGQAVVNYRAEIGKLKEAVSGYSFAELTAARNRVQSSGADREKLAILDAEIARRRTLSDAALEQALAESTLGLAKSEAGSVDSDFGAQQAAAEGNLAALYQLELDFGARVQTARDNLAAAERTDRNRQTSERYAKLLSLEGITDSQIAALNAALTDELKANDAEYTNQVTDNATKRTNAEAQARARLESYLKGVGESVRDTLNKQALDAAAARVSDRESELAAELAAEDLSEAQKYQIRLKYRAVLVALKTQEQAEIARVQEQAESARYEDAVEAARKAGTLGLEVAGTGLTVQENLEREHAALVAGIRKRTADAARDYEIQVKRETGRALISSEKETAQARKNDAAAVVESELGKIEEYTAAQGQAARRVLSGWIEVYQKFPSAIGALAVAELEAAIKKIDGLRDDQIKKNAKLINTAPKQTGADFGSDLLAVGKPEDRASAEASGRAKFDTLRDQYRKLISDVTAALEGFQGVADSALTPDELAVKNGLSSTLALYTGFAAQIETAAATAGQNAGQAYSNAQADSLADKRLALAEAEYRLAELEGRDGSPGYVGGLNAALSYWKARLFGLEAGTDEYLAALTKITDLEAKAQAKQGTSFGKLKADFKGAQTGGLESFNTALSGVAKGFGAIVSPMQLFAAILEKINPVGKVLEGIFSVLEEPIKALQEPFTIIGELIGSVIAPNLELIAPVLRILAEIFTVLYDAIALFIKTITFGLYSIDRRDPNKKKEEDPKEAAAAEQEILDLRSQNDLAELDLKLEKGLISKKAYEQEKLKITLASLKRQEAAEIEAANGDQEKIKEIKRKFTLSAERESIDSIKRISEAYKQIGESLLGSVTSSVKDGLMNALKAGNFGAFRQGFRKNLREAMFEAVVSAAIETAALTAILKPAIDALTAALETDGTADDDAAIRGLLDAGNKVEAKMKQVYRALKPLRDAWGIGAEGDQGQTIEVVGNVSAPQMKISLDMLAFLADVISKEVPMFKDAMNAHTPALNAHAPALAGHTAALSAHTAALPRFSDDMGVFRTSVGVMSGTAETLSRAGDKFLQGATIWRGGVDVHVSAMARHSEALGVATRSAGSAGGGGGFSPKR